MYISAFFHRRMEWKLAHPTSGFLAFAIVSLATSGCQSRPTRQIIGQLIQVGCSPTPTPATVTGAWREAQAYVADRAGADVLLGCGDSMLPLYRNRTLLVTELQPYESWKAGQTVVFVGDHGWPVAHLLVMITAEGWRAAGTARAEFDETLVTTGNYLGTVTKAFELATADATPVTPFPSALRSERAGSAINNLASLSR